MEGLKMQKYTLLIKKELYEGLSQAAGEESIKQKKSILWSRLAREVLSDYVEQHKKSHPPIPEKRCQ